MAAKLLELREKIAAKQKKASEVFEQAGTDLNFDNVKCLNATDNPGKVAELKALNKELEDLAVEAEGLVEIESIRDNVDEIGDELAGNERAERKSRRRGTSLHGDPEPEQKSLGTQITEHDAFKRYAKARGGLEVFEIKESGRHRRVKTLFQTSAGWAPESTRIPGMVIEKATRPLQITDIVPESPTSMAAVVYMEETTRTHAGVETAEAAAYPESTFALTQRSSTVRKIADSLPVTDEQLEDVEGTSEYVDSRLGFGIAQRLDSQILVGGGTGSDLTGIDAASGLQTQAKGADPAFDAILKGIVKVRVTGRAFPSHTLVHATDLQNLRLTRTADGIYILGNPNAPGPDTMWGTRLVEQDAGAAGSTYIGDFNNFIRLFRRRGLTIEVGYVNDDWTKGKQTVRASVRVALVIFRGAAFCKVTGL